MSTTPSADDVRAFFPPWSRGLLFVGYVAGSLLAGDRFPFAVFSMFAVARSQDSCLNVVSGGRNVDYRSYVRFDGRFEGLQSPLLFPWIEREFRSYIQEKSADLGRTDGVESLEARICMSTVDEKGASLDCRTLWRGKARRR